MEEIKNETIVVIKIAGGLGQDNNNPLIQDLIANYIYLKRDIIN